METSVLRAQSESNPMKPDIFQYLDPDIWPTLLKDNVNKWDP